MLFLQKLCAALFDQMGGIQMHFVVNFEKIQLLFQLLVPAWSKQVVYYCISLLLQTLTNGWRYSCLETLQRQSAQIPYVSEVVSSLCFMIRTLSNVLCQA